MQAVALRPRARLLVALSLALLFSFSTWAIVWVTPAEPYLVMKTFDDLGLLKFSPDGKTLLTTRYPNHEPHSGPIRAWDVERGTVRFSVGDNENRIFDQKFSPDGKLLGVLNEGGNLKVFNALTGEEIGSHHVGSEYQWLRFFPDSRLFAAHDNKKVCLWDVAAQQERATINGGLASISPDGNTFATFIRKKGSETIAIWGLEGGTPKLLKEHSVPAYYSIVSPDVKKLVIGLQAETADYTPTIEILDILNGGRLQSFACGERGEPIDALWFFQSSHLLYLRIGRPFLGPFRQSLWDVSETPKLVASTPEFPFVSPDAKLVAIADPQGAALRRVSIESGWTRLTNARDSGPKHNHSIMFSADSRYLAVGELSYPGRSSPLPKWVPSYLNPLPDIPPGNVVRVWDVESGQEELGLTGNGIALFAPDGKTIALKADRTPDNDRPIQLWSLPAHKPVEKILYRLLVVWTLIIAMLFLGWRLLGAGKGIGFAESASE